MTAFIISTLVRVTATKKGPEHHTDRSEQETEYPILHVIFSGLTYGSGGDEDFQHLWGPYKRSEDEDY